MELDKIYCQDCFAGLSSIPDGSVDLIVTDPPYAIERIIGGGSINRRSNALANSLSDLRAHADLTASYDIQQLASHVVRLQPDGINAYFFCNKAQILDYMKVYVDGLGCRFDVICWHKTNVPPTFANKYLPDTEYCLFFHKGRGRTAPGSYDDARTWHLSPINVKDKNRWRHPTVKPLDLVARLIRNSSQPGDVVLDPFMGSGTTAVAALRMGRHFIGFEANSNYYKNACERIAIERNNPNIFSQNLPMEEQQ